MENTEPMKSVEELDIAVANLVFSNLSLEKIQKIPKWLLENIESNKPQFRKALHSYTASREKSERERVSQVIKERSAKSMSSKVPINCEPTELLLKAIYPSTSDVTTE